MIHPAIGNDCYYLLGLQPTRFCPAKIVALDPANPMGKASVFVFNPNGNLEFHEDAMRGNQPGCWFFRGELGIA